MAASSDRVFHALGDPTRRAIVDRLSQGPLRASDLAKPLEISLTAVIQHLQVLEKCGLASTHKTGRVRTCRFEPRGLATVERWISERRLSWEKRYSRLEKLLNDDDRKKT